MTLNYKGMRKEDTTRLEKLSKWEDSLYKDVHVRALEADVRLIYIFDGDEKVAGPFTSISKQKLVPYARGYSEAKKKYESVD